MDKEESILLQNISTNPRFCIDYRRPSGVINESISGGLVVKHKRQNISQIISTTIICPHLNQVAYHLPFNYPKEICKYIYE